ncbi:disintegrin and metalloproteinase domain-containing protein 19 [Kryptolebias marmoratus]|uniref:ADAM metallopeptidase domain 19b n=1 Tax=Kryptolebias marmoratus TaxID=37003 RepID=A0A3Q3A703_KRYMA|nr:disintegrin and metalloproteinase domain-containing protein 19 [Kryptolebias marmoratus]
MRPPPLGAVWSSLCLVVFLHRVAAAAASAGVYNGGNQQSILEHIQSYEITSPIWLHPLGPKRAANKDHPAEVQVLISAEGQELRLHLEKNEQLLAPGYQEIRYGPDGARQSLSPANTAHCFYHGEVLGVEGSSVVVSTCSGLRGLISLNASTSYLVEPLPNSTRRHAVFRAESLHLPRGSCMHHHGNGEHQEGLQDFIHGMMSPRSRREKRELDQNMKYVELLLVADKAEFEWHGQSFEKTRDKLQEAANLVDKYYRALNIRVALIGLEVWTDRDKINMSDNPRSTLDAFLSWRQKMLRTLPNDNAQLVTGRSFQGTTIGLATLRTMCSDYQSGGVNTDHSPGSHVGVAATIAHEMGHNFGMSHDSAGCCQVKPEDGGCIMAAATGDPFPRVFSSCNVQELKSFLDSGGGKCLFNLPNTHLMPGGQRCGNGYLEEGERCDCGEEEECTNPCCNANNCTLKAGAECAHGDCCHNCKLKSPGHLCRAPSGLCDLPEHCDGKTESCPANFYRMDGTSCDKGKAYCYTGMCLTLELQCQSLWGRDALPAPDLCFREVNKAGDMYGNCGKDQHRKYRSCEDRDAKCGKIQCSTSAAKPIENNAVRIETTVSGDKKKIVCLGTHVYNLHQEDEEPQGDTLDPGLVLTGTKCGSDSICFNGECRNASFLRTEECNAKCHGHGLCNNNHNCHCDPGWAPPWCNQSGPGGSVDSGPIPPITFHHVLLLLLAPFVVLVTVGLWWLYTRQNVLLKAPSAVPKCSVTVEDKPLNADHIGHANPTFMLKNQNSASPRPRPAIARPAVKPPPVPAYATEHRAQAPQVPQVPQVPPVTSPPQGQVSPQDYGQPFLRSPRVTEPRPIQVSPPHPGPSSLPCRDLKGHLHPSVTNKHRPDPPKRPPPPCPVKQSEAQHQMKSLQSNINAVQRGKAPLVPSAGQKKNIRA